MSENDRGETKQKLLVSNKDQRDGDAEGPIQYLL